MVMACMRPLKPAISRSKASILVCSESTIERSPLLSSVFCGREAARGV